MKASKVQGIQSFNSAASQSKENPSTSSLNHASSTQSIASDLIPDVPPYGDKDGKKKEKKLILAVVGIVLFFILVIGAVGIYYADSIIPEHDTQAVGANGENPYLSEGTPDAVEEQEVTESEDIEGDDQEEYYEDEEFSGITPLPEEDLVEEEGTVEEDESTDEVDENTSDSNPDIDSKSETEDTEVSKLSDEDKGVEILSYNLDWTYDSNDTVRLSARAESPDSVSKVEFYSDDALVGTVESYEIGGEAASWLDNAEDIYGITEGVGEWLEDEIDEKLDGHVYRNSKDWANTVSSCVIEQGFVHIFISEKKIYDVRTSADGSTNEICFSGDSLNIEDLYYFMYDAPSESSDIYAIVYYDDGSKVESESVELKVK